MIKINITSNEDKALEFVKEIQANPMLSDIVVDLNNVNDCALYLEEKKNCYNCNGLNNCLNSNEGYASVIEDGIIVARPCKYKKQAMIKSKESQLIKTLFIPQRILNADLAYFDNTTENRGKILKYIVNFVNNIKNGVFEKGLYIYGGFSTGKTYILGCIANELARNNIKSLIIYFPDLVVELKSALGTPRFDELLNHLKSVDVLLLDDLGSENMTPWLRDEILGPVLNYRLMEEKPVFVSSNINPTGNDLKNHFAMSKASSDILKASRIQSRLEGLVKPIELDNYSYKR